MGIKFQCPNGHRLHVKSDLAGKRGLCPDCNAKVLIPSLPAAEKATADQEPAGQRAEDLAASPKSTEAPQPPSPETSAVALETPAPQLPEDEQAAVSPAPEIAPPVVAASVVESKHPAEPIEWYVRPVGGGQFGPCPPETFAQWIGEGRVAPESYVWRSGWGDWRLAQEASDTLPAPLPVAVPNTASSVRSPEATPTNAEAPPSMGDGAPAAIRLERARKRRQKFRLVAGIILLLLTIGLGVALVMVLN